MAQAVFDALGITPTGGAPDAQITHVQAKLGIDFPEDNREFLSKSGPVEGEVGKNGYLQLWGTDTLVEGNEGYGAAEFWPGYVIIGSNGGGESFGFIWDEGHVTYFMSHFVTLGPDEAIPMGSTIGELVQQYIAWSDS